MMSVTRVHVVVQTLGVEFALGCSMCVHGHTMVVCSFNPWPGATDTGPLYEVHLLASASISALVISLVLSCIEYFFKFREFSILIS
jgi:hypothetical protein